MKNASTIFPMMIAIAIISSATSASGQERGYDHNRNRNWSGHHNRDRNDRYDNDRKNHRNRHDHDRHVVKHVYHYDRHHHHRPVVIHRYTRPRYIYYRDYDVYYDCHKSVYISYSGKSWTVNTAVPLTLHNVNVRTAKRFEVDYYNDDFPQYLDIRRPSYGRECNDW
jgi:hypothetical protein